MCLKSSVNGVISEQELSARARMCMVLQRHGENRHTAWTVRVIGSWTKSVWEVVSQRNGATWKHQVLPEIGKNCNGNAWNVGAGVREGSSEQKMCLRMVETLSRREGNGWGCHVWVGHQQAEPQNDRESGKNAGTRSATDAKIDCGGIRH